MVSLVDYWLLLCLSILKCFDDAVSSFREESFGSGRQDIHTETLTSLHPAQFLETFPHPPFSLDIPPAFILYQLWLLFCCFPLQNHEPNPSSCHEAFASSFNNMPQRIPSSMAALNIPYLPQTANNYAHIIRVWPSWATLILNKFRVGLGFAPWAG